MTIHPAFLRLSAILPLGVAMLAILLFALEFDILAHGGPTKSERQRLELEEMSLMGTLLSAALGVMALVNRRWMIREHQQRQAAEREATTDVLTGIANRRHFMRIAEEQVRQAVEHEAQCAVLLVDLDRFKPVNDAYGHAAGDAVLVAVAQRLKNAVPDGSIAGRLGGDEFAILLRPQDPVDIARWVSSLEQRIGQPIAYAGQEIRVGASIGMALAHEDGDTVAELIACADQRMYRRKRGGRRLELVAAA